MLTRRRFAMGSVEAGWGIAWTGLYREDPAVIGTLIFHLSNDRHVAELGGDLTWRCETEDVARMLNQNFPIYRVEGEDCETLGRHSLYRAAYRLGGEVRLPTIVGGANRFAGV